ncbi:hypothetical protein EYF80_053374 [Liparis tanakae]|uniref:Uncharacterized protein n=1 Tax=Liparis tanakae TaxID=230148 RepID=A0A4Z2F6R5_9TELE|nr:hypothetical protein EYF80_053374 [Liparis tanakae]
MMKMMMMMMKMMKKKMMSPVLGEEVHDVERVPVDHPDRQVEHRLSSFLKPTRQRLLYNQRSAPGGQERERSSNTLENRRWLVVLAVKSYVLVWLRDGLLQVHPLSVDLHQGQDVSGPDRLVQKLQARRGVGTEPPHEAPLRVLGRDEVLPGLPGGLTGEQSPLKGTHQQLGGPQHVQVQALDPGVVDPHLPVDPRALDTDEHPEVGGQPAPVQPRSSPGSAPVQLRSSPGPVPVHVPGAPQSQQPWLPLILFTSSTMALVSRLSLAGGALAWETTGETPGQQQQQHQVNNNNNNTRSSVDAQRSKVVLWGQRSKVVLWGQRSKVVLWRRATEDPGALGAVGLVALQLVEAVAGALLGLSRGLQRVSELSQLPPLPVLRLLDLDTTEEETPDTDDRCFRSKRNMCFSTDGFRLSTAFRPSWKKLKRTTSLEEDLDQEDLDQEDLGLFYLDQETWAS